MAASQSSRPFWRCVRVQKSLLYVIGLLPLLSLIVSMVTEPPVDPYERIANVTGENALRLLVLTLFVTPIIVVSDWKWLGPFRRTLGVLTFTYAICHMLAYMVFEAEFDFGFVIADVADRRFIAMGMIAFVLMVPLGVTSNNYSVCKLCHKWRKIHYLVYPLAVFACVHFLWLKRGEDLTEPLIYLGLVVALLAFRVIRRWARTRRRSSLTRSSA